MGPDIQIVSLTEVDGQFCIERDRVFDLIALECAHGHEDIVMALMERIDESQSEPTEPGKLRVIKGGADAILDT